MLYEFLSLRGGSTHDALQLDSGVGQLLGALLFLGQEIVLVFFLLFVLVKGFGLLVCRAGRLLEIVLIVLILEAQGGFLFVAVAH